ncbi:U-box domain-containing protein 15 [Linum perenne]
MDEEENGGTSSGEEEIESTSPQGANDVVDSILRVIESVARLGGYRGTHRKECIALVRRMKTFLPFLEEVRDLDTPIPDHGIECLKNLKATFVMAKNLLKTCNEGSKIYLAAEREAVTARFRAVHEKLFNVVESIPYEELGISDEIREQVDLMRKQLKRFNRHSDSQDMELAMDLMFVLSKQDDQSNSDSAIIERIARKLDLDDVENVNNETIAVRNLVRERGGTSHDDTLQHIVDMLNKMRKIVGLEESGGVGCGATKSLAKSPSLIIPHEFLCPITLEIMVDPVIIASGQTYERESIQKWLDANHMTCPKTRQTLDNPSIAPNYALKNIIIQWCDKHKFKLPKKETTDPSAKSSEQCRGIDQVSILGAIPAIVDVLQNGCREAKENSAAALFSLSMLDENKVTIGLSDGIPPLVDLLQHGTMRGKKDALTALFNLCLNDSNKEKAIETGIVNPLFNLLKNRNLNMIDETLSIFLLLASHPEGRNAVGQLPFVEKLVEFMKDGTPKNKECATSVLLELGSGNSNYILMGLQFGVYEHLVEMSETGTDRGKRKANALLNLITKTEQL